MRMKNRKRAGILVFLLLALLLAFGMTAEAGFRKLPNGKYRYYTSRTRYLKGKTTGALNERWTFKNIRYKGKKYTYCFDTNGYRLTGWQRLYTKASDGTTGWSCYYFNRNGQMLKNGKKGGSYFLGNGRLVNGYGKNGNYYGLDGIETEAPDSGGRFVTNKKGTRYRQADGSFVTKTWKCIRENSSSPYYWYYFYSNGYMARNRWVGNHFVDKNGRWISDNSGKK